MRRSPSIPRPSPSPISPASAWKTCTSPNTVTRGHFEDRTIRNGAHAVDVGEPRRNGPERERRAPRDPARTRRDGAGPRRHPRHAAGLQPVQRHRRAARGADAHLPGRIRGPGGSHQRHLRSQLPARAGAAPRKATRWRFEVPNYMQYGGVPQSLGAKVNHFRLRIDQDWEPDWEEFERAVNPKTRLVYLSNPNNPTGSVLSQEAMQRIVRRCEQVGAYLLADEVYLGAEIDVPAHAELLGNERSRDRHQRTFQGVRHSRRAHRLDRGTRGRGGRVLEPARLHHHRAQQDLRRRGAHRGAAGESREALRAHARDPAAQPAGHARVGRRASAAS